MSYLRRLANPPGHAGINAGAARSEAPAFSHDQRLADPGFEAAELPGAKVSVESPSGAAPVGSTSTLSPRPGPMPAELGTLRRKSAGAMPTLAPAAAAAPSLLAPPSPLAPPTMLAAPVSVASAAPRPSAGQVLETRTLAPSPAPQAAQANSALVAGEHATPKAFEAKPVLEPRLSQAVNELAATPADMAPGTSPPGHSAKTPLLAPPPAAPPIVLTAAESPGAQAPQAAQPVVKIGRLEIEVVPPPAQQRPSAAQPAANGPRTAATASVIGSLGSGSSRRGTGGRGRYSLASSTYLRSRART